jgi:ribulose 1,5-bisphosphate carboxylase large subunit-like protein
MWFSQIADEMNAAGYDQKQILAKIAYDIPNTPESIKGIFREVAKNMYGYSSTTELTTKEWTEVSDVMTRAFGEKFGITVPYPSEESLAMNERLKEG